MNPDLIPVQRIIRDLLGHPEELVKQGRLNADRTDFSVDYIVVDSLAPGQAVTTNKKYDPVNEKLTYSARVRMPLTIDFFGDNAYDNARKLQLLLKSDKAFYLQEQHKITLGSFTRITDVKKLTGSQYGNRYQAELIMYYSPSIVEDVLRIDTAIVETITN